MALKEKGRKDTGRKRRRKRERIAVIM